MVITMDLRVRRDCIAITVTYWIIIHIVPLSFFFFLSTNNLNNLKSDLR